MDISVINYRELNEDYLRIEQAILYLENHYKDQPGLEEVAANIGLSEYHFQRVFTRWAGVSPKRFLQFLTKEGAKDLLDQSENLLDTTHQVGLSSLGRLHDLFVTTEAVTPGEYKTPRRRCDHPLWDSPHTFRQMPDRDNGTWHLSSRFRANERRRCHRQSRCRLEAGKDDRGLHVHSTAGRADL